MSLPSNPRTPAPRRQWILIASVVATFIAGSGYLWVRQQRRELVSGARGDGEQPMFSLADPRPVPDFALSDTEGRTVSRDSLIGKVWVADFIFSSCSETCPAMTARMGAIQRRIERDPELLAGMRLVSFSVDPRNDTQGVLAEYASRHDADGAIWSFLRSAEGEVAQLSQQGFALPALENPAFAADPDAPQYLHSDKFVLIDGRGLVRAYFSMSNDPSHIDRLLDYARSLLRETATPEDEP